MTYKERLESLLRKSQQKAIEYVDAPDLAKNASERLGEWVKAEREYDAFLQLMRSQWIRPDDEWHPKRS